MKKNLVLNVQYKNKFKTNKKFEGWRSKKKEIKTFISSFTKIMIIFCFLFLLIFFNFKLVKIKKIFNNNYRRYEKYEKNYIGNSTCHLLDPINIFDVRLKNGPIEICNQKNTKHICYINPRGFYNDIFANKDGVLCIMENIVLDPSKLVQTNFVYNGPVDSQNKGFPVLSKGFLNTKCTPNEINFKFMNLFINLILILGIMTMT